MNTIYERNYKRLLTLVPELMELNVGDALKSTSKEYMDLHFDVLSKNPKKIIIALSHYFQHISGDLIPDPDMEICIYPEMKSIEALTFQNSFGYQRVYVDSNRFYPKLKKSLNDFLSLWLKNCVAQGHLLKKPELEI